MKPSLALPAAFVFAGLAGIAVAAPPPAAKPAPVATAPTAPAVFKLSPADRNFLADVLATNQLEIDVSAYAATQAHSEKVRAFAKARVAAHKELAAQFQKANDGLVAPPGTTSQPGINLLGKTGADFDHAYMTLMAAYDHGLMTRFSVADGPQHGEPIRAMVRATLPTIRKNDAESRALERAVPIR